MKEKKRSKTSSTKMKCWLLHSIELNHFKNSTAVAIAAMIPMKTIMFLMP